MRKLGSLLFTFACGFGAVVACSSADSRPPASVNYVEGGASSSGEGGSDLDAASKVDAAACSDNVKDNAETDVDCGGSVCGPCAINKVCGEDTDCDSSKGLKCANKICASCTNAMTDGLETDKDCGGGACTTCGVGKACLVDGDCVGTQGGFGKCIGANAPTKGSCGCPTDMTIVTLSTGGAYCIDTTEVTKGQYFKFLTANVAQTDQTGACLAANTTFIPRSAYPVSDEPFINGTSSKGYNMGMPVHYVDWCDAVAYCKWSKKVLCGNLDGASLAPADANDASKSAWFNACSAQGTKVFPYGATTVNADSCNGAGAGSGADPMTMHNVNNTDYGYRGSPQFDDGVYEVALSDDKGNITAPSHLECVGGSVNLFQMSGNVAEWEDNCDGTGATANCAVRGGSYTANNNGDALKCAAARTVVRMPTTDADLADIGIRCCLF